MPQPFTYKTGKLVVGPSALLEHPRIAHQMMIIISLYSALEYNIALAFVVLLGGNDVAALEIYNTFINQNLKEEAFSTIAKRKLDKNLFGKFSAFFKEYRKAGKLRNHIAHGTWANLDSQPGYLLLCARDYERREVHRRIQAALNRESIPAMSNVGVVFTKYNHEEFSNACLDLMRLNDEFSSLINELLIVISHLHAAGVGRQR